MKALTCSLLLLTVLTLATSAADVPQSALLPQLAEYGGVCSVVACERDPELLTALLADGDLLVHGLVLDEAGLTAANQAVAATGVHGLVSVEHLSLAPLPYRDYLVNSLLIIDPAAAAAAGLTAAESARVVAPGGRICSRTADGWRVSVQPFPDGMDEWTHPDHGADGNRLSHDTVVSHPFGYRWHGGLPMNINNPVRQTNRWSATRGLAVTNGRLFLLSDSVIENVATSYQGKHGTAQYITARDAFNGMLLWRRSAGETYYGGLFFENKAPFAAVGNRVYAASGAGTLLVMDAATGAVVRELGTAHPPGRLLVTATRIVVAGWREGSQIGGTKGVDRRRMDHAIDSGTVECFARASGERVWYRDVLATSAVAADGRLYITVRDGADPLGALRRAELKRRGEEEALPPRPKQTVVAYDLASGNELWRYAPEAAEAGHHLRVSVARQGMVVVTCNNGERNVVLASATGEVTRTGGRSYAYFVDGKLALGGELLDPATGESAGKSPVATRPALCTPSHHVNGIQINNRQGSYAAGGKSLKYAGARGSCLFGSVPAHGAFFNAQDWCACMPPQIRGLMSFGGVGMLPTAAEMAAPHSVTRGPAFGTATTAAATDAADWLFFRAGAERGSSTTASIPAALAIRWQRMIGQTPAGRVARNWQEALSPPVTQAAVSANLAIVADSERNRVVALDAATGDERWQYLAGGRVDSTPTIVGGLCVFGAHDGVVYAVTRATGTLAWKFRAAPRDARMLSYGKVESPWPVLGSVLVDGDTGYVSAGRSQGSDGGIVVRAFDLTTGAHRWATALGESKNHREMRRNDILVKIGDNLQMMTHRLALADGSTALNPSEAHTRRAARVRQLKRVVKQHPKRQPQLDELLATPAPEPEIAPGIGLEGFICASWPRLGDRKYRRMTYGNISAHLLAWDALAVAALNNFGREIVLYPVSAVGPTGAPKPTAHVRSWAITLDASMQATSLVLCKDAVVAAGAVHTAGTVSRGFLAVYDRADGRKRIEIAFEAPVPVNGVAVAGPGLLVSLADGSVAALGAPPAP
jgi:outer membrane protein assembly factor BamB